MNNLTENNERLTEAMTDEGRRSEEEEIPAGKVKKLMVDWSNVTGQARKYPNKIRRPDRRHTPKQHKTRFWTISRIEI